MCLGMKNELNVRCVDARRSAVHVLFDATAEYQNVGNCPPCSAP